MVLDKLFKSNGKYNCLVPLPNLNNLAYINWLSIIYIITNIPKKIIHYYLNISTKRIHRRMMILNNHLYIDIDLI